MSVHLHMGWLDNAVDLVGNKSLQKAIKVDLESSESSSA